MKLIDVFKAREPLMRLTEKRFNNYKVLRQLVKARKAVTAEVEFYAEAEKKAVAQYAEKDEKPKSVTEYEPDSETLFDLIVPQYTAGLAWGAVTESWASELAARRTAMDSASKNANEMVAQLSLQYNRARQAAITQEITEIVSGAGDA